jgi:predicted nucleic acid-binding protein
LVAWLDGEDQWHDAAVALSKELRPPFFTCEPVVAEACFLLQHLPKAIAQVGAWFDGGQIQIPFRLQSESLRIFALMHKYRDLPMSLADASLVAMVESGHGDRVFTLDKHFRVYRHSGRRVLPVLMPE